MSAYRQQAEQMGENWAFPPLPRTDAEHEVSLFAQVTERIARAHTARRVRREVMWIAAEHLGIESPPLSEVATDVLFDRLGITVGCVVSEADREVRVRIATEATAVRFPLPAVRVSVAITDDADEAIAEAVATLLTVDQELAKRVNSERHATKSALK